MVQRRIGNVPGPLSWIVFLAALVSGCGTVQSLLTYPEPYGGVIVAANRDPSAGEHLVIMAVDLCVSAAADTVLLPVTIPVVLSSGDSSGRPTCSVDVELPLLEGELFFSSDSSMVCAGWIDFDRDGPFARGFVVPVSGDRASVTGGRLPADLVERFPGLGRELKESRLLARVQQAAAAGENGKQQTSIEDWPILRFVDDTRALCLIAGEDFTTIQLWEAGPAGFTMRWETQLPLDELSRHRAIVSRAVFSGQERILLSVAPGPTRLLDPADGSVTEQFGSLDNLDVEDEISGHDVFSIDTTQDLIARGAWERGVVQVVRLNRRDAWRRTLKVPWGFECLWWVGGIRFAGDGLIAIEFRTNWQPSATVIYSLEDSRVVWSEASESIDSVVVSPDGKWVAYLNDDEGLEIVPLSRGTADR